MPTLQLQLLGYFQLLVNGAAMPIHQARLQSLLAYMFLHRNTSQARQQLAFVFWPDSTEAKARANLRKALYDLRHVFADLAHFVQVESQHLQLQASATVTLDVTNFEELPACYDDWLLRERERLRQRYLSSLEEPVYLLEDRHELHAAILHAQQLLQADPLHESTYRTLVRLHLQNGDRARAPNRNRTNRARAGITDGFSSPLTGISGDIPSSFLPVHNSPLFIPTWPSKATFRLVPCGMILWETPS